MTRSVGICLFDEVEVLDLGGPFEVFSTASRMKLVARIESEELAVRTARQMDHDWQRSGHEAP